MKLIGRSATSLFSGEKLERISLWIEEVSSARWQSFADIRTSFPSAIEVARGEIHFPLVSAGISVQTHIAFNTSVISLIGISENSSAKDS